MSSFIVSAETMQRCVSALAEANCKQLVGTELGRSLYRMNASGPLDLTEEDIEWEWRLNFGGMRTNRRRLPADRAVACDWLKALECLLYNCPGVARTTEPYQRVQRTIESYRAHIVEQLTEYKSAKWDS